MSISFAMSFGFVTMLLFLSLMQSSGDVSKFLNTLLFIFFGLFHIFVCIWILLF